MPSYELSPQAVDDLLEIQEHIAQDNPVASEALIEEFFGAFEHLARWPRAGHARTDLTEQQVLFWPVRSYLVVYRAPVGSVLLQIVAVLHGARDLSAILRER
jgi:plasmid stabilization system protein ParE